MGESVLSLLQELYPECEEEKLRDLLRAFAGVTLNEQPPRPGTLRNKYTVEQLPDKMEVTWNPRLIKSAGFCKFKRSSKKEHYCIIDLSPKICTTAGRIRDTLLHEMCHAATWLIDKIAEGHGPHWRKWSSLKTRHSYKATTKFAYECTKCSYSVQFSKAKKTYDYTSIRAKLFCFNSRIRHLVCFTIIHFTKFYANVLSGKIN
ncbi:Acidic repeat-containing protein [Trichuris trichiura]|uniref:Acidic repeat-containing protein n=1 Tax=Trichuris trichiura TaxID=36087 RepID=A0A077Z6K6_TRITR|nr:Acidic repeat-containing protein [Trichuris trichiura]